MEKFRELTKKEVIKATQKLGDIFWKDIEGRYWSLRDVETNKILTAILSIHYRLKRLEKAQKSTKNSL